MFHTPAHKNTVNPGAVVQAFGLNTKIIFRCYVHCALWASTDGQGQSLDDGRDVDDLPAKTLAKMHEDVEAFVSANRADLHRSALDYAQIGHDFWLTRNGHGSGFWDRGIGAVGDRLTAAAKAWGSADLYLGDDGLVYQA